MKQKCPVVLKLKTVAMQKFTLHFSFSGNNKTRRVISSKKCIFKFYAISNQEHMSRLMIEKSLKFDDKTFIVLSYLSLKAKTSFCT